MSVFICTICAFLLGCSFVDLEVTSNVFLNLLEMLLVVGSMEGISSQVDMANIDDCSTCPSELGMVL